MISVKSDLFLAGWSLEIEFRIRPVAIYLNYFFIINSDIIKNFCYDH